MSLQVSPILVPTDFSDASVEALAYAARLAAATGAEVRVLHVLADAARRSTESEATDAHDAAETAQVLEAVRQLAASVDPGLRCRVRRSQAPAEGIVEEAEAVGAGLIVLGTCGQRPVHVGLGAVSGEVIQTAPCDVLLVPHRLEAPYAQAPVRRLLVPVDFSAASAPLLALGCELAEALEAQVDLVHVLEPLPHPIRWLDETFVDLVPQIQERAEVALRAVAEGASASLGGIYVERGKAAPSIPRVADALGTDLIVLGPHAERPVFDRLLGSVAEGVARRASCPVLVARVSAAPEGGTSPGVDRHSYEAVM